MFLKIDLIAFRIVFRNVNNYNGGQMTELQWLKVLERMNSEMTGKGRIVPLDILILSQIDVVPLCLVQAKVIGVMRMLDNGEADDKIISVATGDPSVSHINNISELPKHFISELKSFFEDYKKLENKSVVVEEFFDKETALKILKESFVLYKKTFPK